MNSLLDKLYDGLDKQEGGVYHMGDSHWNIEVSLKYRGNGVYWYRSNSTTVQSLFRVILQITKDITFLLNVK